MNILAKIKQWIFDDKAHLRFDRGFAFYKSGKLDNAIAAYTASIKANPSFAWSYDGRGNAHCAKGDLEAGLADYEKATSLLPDHAGMLGNLGRCYRMLGRLPAARDVLQKAVKLDPAHANNHWFMAETLADLGEKDDARAAYVRFARLPRRLRV